MFIADTVVSGNKIWFTDIASFAPRNHVIFGRFSLDGTLDFSTIVRPCNADPNDPQDSTSTANKISLQPDGKLLVIGKCGAFNATNFANPFALRINTNGTLDTTFNGTGTLRFPEDQNVNLLVNKIIRQPDGKYLISGAISNGWGGYRVNSNGTLDSTYGNRNAPGIAWFSPPTGNSNSVPAILPDGSMIQIAYANVGVNTIIRLVKIRQNQNRNANRYDFDGDAKTDISIFRPSVGEWYYLRSSDSQVRGAQFGSPTDKAVQGDYTGDGKADFAFFRPLTGSWFVLRSEDSSFFASPFGVSTDTPTPGDYDGDGKFDQAVFRPSNGVWYLNRTTAGVQIQQFGVGTDLPVPAAFVP